MNAASLHKGGPGATRTRLPDHSNPDGSQEAS